jgi:hypothetical protein
MISSAVIEWCAVLLFVEPCCCRRIASAHARLTRVKYQKLSAAGASIDFDSTWSQNNVVFVRVSGGRLFKHCCVKDLNHLLTESGARLADWWQVIFTRILTAISIHPSLLFYQHFITETKNDASFWCAAKNN